MTPRYSVIIPAHNEASRIESTLRDYISAFADSEIIAVLNGCSDDTEAIVRRLRAQHRNLVLLVIEDAIGKGGAVRAGFLVARAPVVAYVDADHATTAAEMRRLCDSLGDGDGIIASRWIAGAIVSVPQPLRRRFASRVFNNLVRLLFGLKYSDTQCGAKVFRLQAIRKILPDVETANFAFDVDLLYAMKAAGMRVREAPTVWRDVDGSRLHLISASSHMLASILRLRIRHSFLRMVVPLFDRMFPTKPMRIHDGFNVLLLNWRDPKHPQAGGAEAYLYEMASRWVGLGHSVEWLSAGFPGAKPKEIVGGIPVTRVGNALTVYAALPLEYLRNFRDRFDIIIDAENGIPFFSPLFSLKPKICVIHHVHKDVFKKHLAAPLAFVLTWLECWLMPRVYRKHRFVAVSEDTRDALHAIGVSRQSIDIVHNGVDSSLKPGEKFDRPTLAYLGRLKTYKRIDRIIDALVRVRTAIPETVLHVAGDGDDRQRLERYANDRGVGNAVIFEGYVDEARKRRLLQGAWAFVSASEIEGWGISVVEANACGTPAISYSVPGLREVIVNGFNGITIDEGGDLAEPILTVLQDAAERMKLEEGALVRAAEFSWDRSAQSMLDLITRSIIGDQLGLVRVGDDWSWVKRALREEPVAHTLARVALHPDAVKNSAVSP